MDHYGHQISQEAHYSRHPHQITCQLRRATSVVLMKTMPNLVIDRVLGALTLNVKLMNSAFQIFWLKTVNQHHENIIFAVNLQMMPKLVRKLALVVRIANAV